MTDAKVELLCLICGEPKYKHDGSERFCRMYATYRAPKPLEQSDAVMGENVLFNPDDSAEDRTLTERLRNPIEDDDAKWLRGLADDINNDIEPSRKQTDRLERIAARIDGYRAMSRAPKQ